MSLPIWPRSRPATPTLRSMVGRMFWWVISVGMVLRLSLTRVLSSTGRIAVVGRPLHATDDGGLPVGFNPAIMLALVDAGEGHVEQGLDRFDTCLRVLDADEVLVAVGVVDPEVGLVVLNARIEGADDALHDVFLG